MEKDKQMSLRFEPSVLPPEAASSDPASTLPGPAILEQSAAVQRTALILQMPVSSARCHQATQERDSDLLGRILNRVKLF